MNALFGRHTSSDDLQDDDRQRRRFKHAGDSEMDQDNGCKQPQQQKTYAGPTTGKRRK
jgi:hypothetical protein